MVSFPIPFALKGWSPFGVQVGPQKCISCPSMTLQRLLISLRVKSKVLKIIDRALLHLVSRSRPELSTYSPRSTPTFSPVVLLASLEFCPPDICVADSPTFFRSSPQGSFFKRDVVDHSFENLFPFFSSGLLYFDASHIPHFQCALSGIIIFKSLRKVLKHDLLLSSLYREGNKFRVSRLYVIH